MSKNQIILSIFFKLTSDYAVFFMTDILSYFYLINSVLSIFLMIFIWTRFKIFTKIIWLVLLIFCFSFIEFFQFSFFSEKILDIPHIFRIPNVTRALIPVLLFFYTKKMMDPERNLKRYEYLHFLFPIIIFIAIVPDILLPIQEKIDLLKIQIHQNKYILQRPIGFFKQIKLQPFSMVTVMLYSIYNLYNIIKSESQFNDFEKRVNSITLIWLKSISIFVFIYFLSEFLGGYLAISYKNQYNLIIFGLIQLAYFFLFISLIIFKNLQENLDGCIKTIIKGEIKEIPPPNRILPKIKERFEKDKLVNEFSEKLFSLNCFYNPDCNIEMVSKSLKINSNKLSVDLKSYFEMGFPEFLNKIRIHRFIELVKKNKHFTLEALIYECGFKNRSTFYLAFKKYIGVNPKFYLDNFI